MAYRRGTNVKDKLVRTALTDSNQRPGTHSCGQVVMNGLIIIVILTNKRMHNVTYVLITNLAISDMLFAGVVLPQNIHDISHTEDYFEGVLACKLVTSLPIFFIGSAAYTLTMLSWERYRAIVETTKKQLTFHDSKFYVAGLWIASFIVIIPTLIEYNVLEVIDTTSNDTNTTVVSCSMAETSRMFTIVNVVFVTVTIYVLPLIIITINYTRVAMYINRMSKRINSDTGLSTTSNNFILHKRRLRIVSMLAMATLLFGLSWLPYFILHDIITIAGQSDSTENDTIWNALRIALAIFSTMYNFILYIKFSSQFRKGLVSVLTRASAYVKCKQGNNDAVNEMSVQPSPSITIS
uniref:Neuromedin-K receptor-like n=1 Tax=Saccoglossus kowalevskii TaxID=10224 RepID=A0ABM0MUE0_SACKO|nr:PREDICTED: neuromedin-K receptor-like [Saccoglossus kowalevskii]